MIKLNFILTTVLTFMVTFSAFAASKFFPSKVRMVLINNDYEYTLKLDPVHAGDFRLYSVNARCARGAEQHPFYVGPSVSIDSEGIFPKASMSPYSSVGYSDGFQYYQYFYTSIAYRNEEDCKNAVLDDNFGAPIARAPLSIRLTFDNDVSLAWTMDGKARLYKVFEGATHSNVSIIGNGNVVEWQ